MNGFKDWVSKSIKIKDIHLNKNIISYLICVIIASILWLLNTLNKEYTTEISYPVKYINFPEGQYPVVKLPSQLQLEVKAKGFALLGYQIKTSFLPITFNVSTYSSHFQKKNDINEYILNTNDIKDKIGSQLSNDIKLLNIVPEEILFRFANARSKKIAIRPVIDYTLKRQYIQNKLYAYPDSILVSGPAIIIDTLSFVSTVPLHLENVGKNIHRNLELVPVPDCTFKEKYVEITLEVEQFTEAKHVLSITPLQVPDSINIRLFPSNVSVSYEIGLSKYDKVSDKDFIFSVDYPTTDHVTYLEVKAYKIPPFIKNLSFSPQKVEYILEKK